MSKRVKTPVVPAPASAPVKRDPRVFHNKLRPEETPEQATAGMMADGLSMNTIAAIGYSKMLRVFDVTDAYLAVDRETKTVQGGDLGALEAMLTAQAVTLNAMFTQLARQASQMTLIDTWTGSRGSD